MTQEININENYDEYNKWFKDFYAPYKYTFKGNKRWFDRTQTAHKKLRDAFGSTKLEMKNIQWQGNKSNRIADAIDTYASYSKILAANKCAIHKMFMDGMVLDKYQREQKPARFILNNLVNKDTTETETNYIRDFTSYVGSILKQYEKTNIKIELSTETKDFVNLGHYGFDETCYRQQGAYASSKYYLAQSYNTFVLLVKDEKENAMARAWGIVNFTDKSIYIDNGYSQSGCCIQEIMKSSALSLGNKLFEKDLLPSEEYQINLNEDHVYVNNEGYTFSEFGDYTEFNTRDNVIIKEPELCKCCDEIYSNCLKNGECFRCVGTTDEEEDF